VHLALVRHAEPFRVEPHETGGGPADPALTPAGVEQAQRLATWFALERVDAVVSSPSRRARETAAPVAAAHGLAVEVVDGLEEYDARADHYIPIEELKAANDPRWVAMLEGRWEEFGGEPPARFRERVRSTLDSVVAAHPGERVVVACHGGVVNVALADVLRLDRLLWFDPGYTSVSRVVASRDGVRSVVSVNETAHLYADRTGPGPST
jgi:probable phosphoglycerate mutase